MNKLIFVTLIAASFASTAMGAGKASGWQVKALKAIKTEKTVLNAKWRMPETNVLWVSMEPDGSRRDGFAQMLCMEFSKAGAPEGELKTVFIYAPADYESGNQPIGMAACR